MFTCFAILVVAALRCPVPGAADDLAEIQAARGLRVAREGDVVRGVSTSGDPAVACALLPRFPELETLWLANSDAADSDLIVLAELRQLRGLSLRCCTRVTDRTVRVIGSLTRLESLDLSETAVTDEGLAALGALSELRTLDLAQTAVTDSGLRALARLPKLERLQLCGTRVTGSGFDAFAELPQLRELGLGSSAVEDSALAHVARCSRLEELFLGDNHALSDGGLAQLAACRGLRVLDLSGTRATSAGIALVRGMGRLAKVDLSSTAVDDAVLDCLRTLPALAVANLDDTRVTYGGLAAFLRAQTGIGQLLPPRHWPEQERALLSAEFPVLTRLGCGGVSTGEPWYAVLRRERRAAALRSPLTDAIQAADAAGARAAIAAGADLERGIPCSRLHRAGPAAADRVQDTTPLALACRFGERAIVEALLAAGARADARLADGSTALMEAAARGDVEVVRALLAHGADPDARDRQGWTALVSALEQDRFDCARELRGAGAGPPRGPALREVVARALRRSDGLARLSALIDLGAALAEVDGHGSIGLVELATRLPNALDLIPVLVAKGADVDRRSHARDIDAIERRARADRDVDADPKAARPRQR